MISVFTWMNIFIFMNDDKIEDKFSNFYFRSVCIKLVALRMNLYQKVALSFKKVGDPCSMVFHMIVTKKNNVYTWKYIFYTRFYYKPTEEWRHGRGGSSQ